MIRLRFVARTQLRKSAVFNARAKNDRLRFLKIANQQI